MVIASVVYLVGVTKYCEQYLQGYYFKSQCVIATQMFTRHSVNFTLIVKSL